METKGIEKIGRNKKTEDGGRCKVRSGVEDMIFLGKGPEEETPLLWQYLQIDVVFCCF